ncbi:PREDICTED: uncharacterized protein LOC109317573 [Crocodylus porosus]|uniref:uncharacterized protein LOC109317573 n=1 Tax=Crocodylus porosus TaxID=8502 RepID=UPI00093EDC36|nr:PREDICTED: uncharacterized protein LOC109317573 [Crocodylus porosus]XP_019401860.1 PREDICTED: uncharacterized protein LOC109317573 [Crocodylus porosus]
MMSSVHQAKWTSLPQRSSSSFRSNAFLSQSRLERSPQEMGTSPPLAPASRPGAVWTLKFIPKQSSWNQFLPGSNLKCRASHDGGELCQEGCCPADSAQPAHTGGEAKRSWELPLLDKDGESGRPGPDIFSNTVSGSQVCSTRHTFCVTMKRQPGLTAQWIPGKLGPKKPLPFFMSHFPFSLCLGWATVGIGSVSRCANARSAGSCFQASWYFRNTNDNNPYKMGIKPDPMQPAVWGGPCLQAPSSPSRLSLRSLQLHLPSPNKLLTHKLLQHMKRQSNAAWPCTPELQVPWEHSSGTCYFTI